jgi:uncharacterized membrane protein YfcA
MDSIRQVFGKVAAWLRSRTRAQIDFIVIVLMAIPAYLVLVTINAFDLIHDWSRAHENWQADEILALGFCLGIASIVFGWRSVHRR